jgi:hypothetical protein
MNIEFTINVRTVQRIVCAMLVTLLVVAGLPMFQPGQANAAQVAERSIQLSDASLSGGSITSGVGSGTNVTYQVTFTPVSDAEYIVIDFCITTPIIGDVCTAPTGMGAATGMSNVSGTAAGTGWALTASASQARLTSGGSNDIIGGVEQVFRLTGITNPSTVDAVDAGETGTFYARIYTFADSTDYATYTNAGTPGDFTDYGGIALSLNQLITITARVQEQLTFCVTSADFSTWTTTGGCNDGTVIANPPALTLGLGTPTAVLDPSRVDTDNAYTQLSTNATNGAVINMRNSNLTCGGLSADNGTTCAIPAIGTNAAMTAGTAAFGLFVSDSTLGHDGNVSNIIGTGTITPTTAYNDGVNETAPNLHYGMPASSTPSTAPNTSPLPPSSYSGEVNSLFGSTIAYTTAPTYRVNNTLTFAATSALTTPAGIYTANLSLIATGTF